MKTKKINIYYIFIICFSSILMFGCKFFNKPMDVYLEKYTKEIFVEDYKFDNEWISTRDGSIVIQPGNTNLEVIIFNSMGVELNPKLEVVSGNWNEDSKFSAISSANNLIFSCKLENIEEGENGVLQLSWPTKDGLRTFAPYNFPNIICNEKPPTPENLQVGESNLSWSLDATVGNSIVDDLDKIDILLSQEGATSYTTKTISRDESGWKNLTVSGTNYTYTLTETEKIGVNTEFAVVVYDEHGQKSVNSTEGFLAKAAPKTEKDETTGATIHLIESYENMLWIAYELKVGAMTSFNIKLTNDIEIPGEKWTSPLDVTNASTIDGQGHSIKFDGGSGLFDRFHGGSIENLVLEGTINTKSDKNHFSGQCGVGVLAGSTYKTRIKNVVSTVNVVDTGNGYVGGLIGYFGGNSDMNEYQPGSFIQNCAVYANITSTNGTVGGLVGGTWSGTRCWQINNCIYAGTVTVTEGTDKVVGAIIGTHHTGRTSTFKDTWYCANGTSEIVGKYDNEENGENFNGYVGTVISKTTAEIASAEAAALLGDAWEYVEGKAYPTLKSVN